MRLRMRFGMQQEDSDTRRAGANRGRRAWGRRLLPLLSALFVGVIALAGCGSQSQATIPGVTMVAKDYAFEAPQTVPIGLVSITLDNQGKEDHQINIARLRDGVTREQITQALQGPPDQLLPLLSFVGGVNTIAPGKQQTVVVNLPAGEYMGFCFVASPDGKAHVEKGMTAYFTANQPSGTLPAEPAANGQVTLKDFSIDVPDSLSSGATTWKVWNNGSQPHELALVKLAEGKMMSDFEAYMQNPSGDPPYISAGGMGALEPGMTGWTNLTLEPGDYLAFCFVPDPSTGKAHMELGMMKSFTVK